MQKIINALAVLSFLGTASIIGGGTYLYLQKDALIDGVKVTKAAVEGVANSLPKLVDAQVPPMPSATGPVLPGLKK